MVLSRHPQRQCQGSLREKKVSVIYFIFVILWKKKLDACLLMMFSDFMKTALPETRTVSPDTRAALPKTRAALPETRAGLSETRAGLFSILLGRALQEQCEACTALNGFSIWWCSGGILVMFWQSSLDVVVFCWHCFSAMLSWCLAIIVDVLAMFWKCPGNVWVMFSKQCLR